MSGHLGDAKVKTAFDNFVFYLNYPMFVVTVASDEQRAGCLVGFATQCSLDPPRLVVCLSRQNHTHRVALSTSDMAVHVLGDHQEEVARLFGQETGDEVDKFARCRWYPGPGGVPILDGCPAWLVARVHYRLALGDHTGFVVEPTAGGGEVSAGAVLDYASVADFDPGHPA